MKFLIAALIALVAVAAPVSAQEVEHEVFNKLFRIACVDLSDSLVRHLERDYGETKQMSALTTDGSVVSVLSNPDTGSWTLVVFSPDGTACMPLAGKESWEEYEQVVPVPGEPT